MVLILPTESGILRSHVAMMRGKYYLNLKETSSLPTLMYICIVPHGTTTPPLILNSFFVLYLTSLVNLPCASLACLVLFTIGSTYSCFVL